VGYAGGTTDSPSYHKIGDHTETVQIDYDPSRISYKELLDIYWESHNATGGSLSRQYRSAIFYHNEEQRKRAEETGDLLMSGAGRRISTAIEPYSAFTLAEDYHQKHSLRLFPEIMEELKSIYPDMKSFVSSVAVTRINGYLGRYGTCTELKKEVDSFGLSVAAMNKLIEVVCGRRML
jgi:methionine-S-sulfoxide reductase